MVSRIAIDDGKAVGPAHKAAARVHNARGEIGVRKIVAAVKARWVLQDVILRIALMTECVIEPLAGPPQEADAQLPRGLREAVEFSYIELEIAVKERRQDGDGGFAHADDADFRRPYDLDLDVRDDRFDGDG